MMSNSQRGYSSSSLASNASNGSLTTAFVHLDHRQVDFFDRVIDLLPEDAHSFGDLKRAYNHACVEQRPSFDAHADTALWDTLLHLTHVRGRTWAQRWDAVLLALGREPRIASDDSATPSEGEEQESDTPKRHNRVDVNMHRNASLISRRERAPSSVESPAAAVELRRRSDRGSTQDEIRALHARMAALTVEATSLASSLDHPPTNSIMHGPIARPSILVSARERDRSGRNQQLRFASSNEQFDISKATTVESASDEETPITPSVGRMSLQDRHSSSSTPAKRRFEEVVARSRSERDAWRRAEEAQQEADEEARSEPARRAADRLLRRNLTRKSLAWWATLYRKIHEQHHVAIETRDRHLKAKALQAWHTYTARHTKKIVHAGKVDVVRCRLRAWRIWQRKMAENRKKIRDDRRTELRGAFKVTQSRLAHRLVKSHYDHWRLVVMQRRATQWRKEHLLRGAMSIWHIQTWRSSKLRDSEDAVAQRRDGTMLTLALKRWRIATQTHEQTNIAQSYDRQQSLQRCFNRWIATTVERKAERKREALADRWHNRRIKAHVWQTVLGKTRALRALAQRADEFRNARLRLQRAQLFTMWTVRERENLFARITAERTLAAYMERWRDRREALTASLQAKERRLISSRSARMLANTFTSWRETAEKSVELQRLAAKRDGRKILSETLALWKAAHLRKERSCFQARAVDAFVLQRRCFAVWMERRREIKLDQWQATRNVEGLRLTFSFWRADAAQKRREALAVATCRTKIERRIRGEVMRTWLDRVIESKSRYMLVADGRDRIVVQQAWQRWMQSCIRHDDMLNLSKSFLDVKGEEWLRRLFAKWSSKARAERTRRERVERFVAERSRELVRRVLDSWYDHYAEATLHDQELDVLLQRQAAVKQSIIKRWQARTPSLPAIQLDHIRLTSHAFHRWHEALPVARLQRTAVEHDTLSMQGKAFDHWLRQAKTKRAFRAAARFGGPSAIRLRSAHRRSSAGPSGGPSSGGVFGGAGGGVGRTPRRRNRSIAAVPARRDMDVVEAGKATLYEDTPTPSGAHPQRPTERLLKQREADMSSLRESDFAMTAGSTSTRGMSPTKSGRAAPAHELPNVGRMTLAQLTTEPGRMEEQRAASPSRSEAALRNLASPPPALRRWMQGVALPSSSSRTDSESSTAQLTIDALSEPPTRKFMLPARRPTGRDTDDHDTGRGKSGHADGDDDDDARTPSPISRTQSEATVRVRNSPRKRTRLGMSRPATTASSSANAMIDLLRSRRRRIPERDAEGF